MRVRLRLLLHCTFISQSITGLYTVIRLRLPLIVLCCHVIMQSKIGQLIGQFISYHCHAVCSSQALPNYEVNITTCMH